MTANAKLVQYTEITPKNIDSFHLHGSAANYPVSAVLAVAKDLKSATLLRGRYVEDKQEQITKPDAVIDALMENIFRIKNVIDAVIMIVGLATILAIILVFVLSLRLRQGEISTIFKIGCSRLTVVRLLVAEIAIIALLSTIICAALLWLMQGYSIHLVRALILA